jgi:hypothetical protein
MRSPQFALSTMDTGGDSLVKGVMKIPAKYSPPNPGELAKKMFDDFYSEAPATTVDAQTATADDPNKGIIDKLNEILGKSIGLPGAAFTSGFGDFKRDLIVATAGIVVLGIGVYVISK